jgi:RND family efflux transporter MFP subunit
MITDASTVRIQVAVPENEASLVTVGQGLGVSTEATGTKAFKTKVARIAGALEHPSQTMLVEGDLANPSGELKPGMFATVKLGLETHAGASLLPLTAVVMEKAVATAYVDEGGVARRRVLKAGFNDGVNLEVLGGLKPDEAVVLPAGAPLSDGQRLK